MRRGVAESLLRAVQSFYVRCRACVRLRGERMVSGKGGLRQGCATPPWLSNEYWCSGQGVERVSIGLRFGDIGT